MLKFLRLHRRKLPPLFKCVLCERRPGEVYHNHIPLCRSCATTLGRHIAVHGSAVIDGIDAMRQSTVTDRRDAIAQQVIDHASKLVPYEDQHLQTTEPEPTRVILQVRAGEIDNLQVQLYAEDNT